MSARQSPARHLGTETRIGGTHRQSSFQAAGRYRDCTELDCLPTLLVQDSTMTLTAQSSLATCEMKSMSLLSDPVSAPLHPCCNGWTVVDCRGRTDVLRRAGTQSLGLGWLVMR